MLTPSQINKLKKIKDPIVRKRYAIYFQLPQELRQLFFADATANQMREIAEKNNLDKKQLWWASYTVGMVLLGEIHITNFVKALQEKCNLTEEKARQLAREINQVIFLPVKESLKKVHQVSEWPRENETVARPTPSPPPSTEPRLNGNIVNLKGE
jgi:hypothetical protein